MTKTKVILLILTIFFVTNLTFGQTIKKDEKDVKLDPDTKAKIKTLVDSLAGDWELIRTICISNGDTLDQEPSSAPMGMTTAEPPTSIHLDTSQEFKISQWCMKCPFIEWTGHYSLEIRSFNGLGLFYLNFKENRDKALKKNQESFTAGFNGVVTNFENGILQLTDDNGCDWIYKRTIKP